MKDLVRSNKDLSILRKIQHKKIKNDSKKSDQVEVVTKDAATGEGYMVNQIDLIPTPQLRIPASSNNVGS